MSRRKLIDNPSSLEQSIVSVEEGEVSYVETNQVVRLPLIEVDLQGKNFKVPMNERLGMTVLYISLVKLALGEDLLGFLKRINLTIADYQNNPIWPPAD